MADAPYGWNDWPQERVDALLATFRDRGWSEAPWQQSPEHAHLFTKAIPDHGSPDTVIQVPIDTWARDTVRLCRDAAERLVLAENLPLLHLGPLTARETAIYDALLPSAVMQAARETEGTP